MPTISEKAKAIQTFAQQVVEEMDDFHDDLYAERLTAHDMIKRVRKLMSSSEYRNAIIEILHRSIPLEGKRVLFRETEEGIVPVVSDKGRIFHIIESQTLRDTIDEGLGDSYWDNLKAFNSDLTTMSAMSAKSKIRTQQVRSTRAVDFYK